MATREGRNKFALLASDLDFEASLREDIQDIADLEPGWSSCKRPLPGEVEEEIPDEAYDFASKLLVECKKAKKLPNALLPSPMQTINFRFAGGMRIIVDGDSIRHGDVNLFDGKTTATLDWKDALEMCA
jgi:hypothetical protein